MITFIPAVPRAARALITLAVLPLSMLVGCGGGSKSVTPPPPPPPTGNFALAITPASVTVVPGGQQQAQVQVTRTGGFTGAVTVSCSGAPTNVSVSPQIEVAGTASAGTLTITAGTNAPETPWDRPATVTCSGTAVVTGTSSSTKVAVTFDNSSFVPTALDLPIIRLTTQNAAPIVSREDYVSGHITIEPNGADQAYAFDADMQIRGRGNSSWGLAPKKSYKVKLLSKASLFGFPADKEWALLANYADKTLLRNMTAMELSRRFGMAYTPRSTPVEVFLNGNYSGTYLLIESIKIATGRVNITKMATTDTAGETLTGGYLIEADEREDQAYHFQTTHGVKIGLHEPDPPTTEQFDYVKNYVQQTEDAIFGSNFADPATGYAAYMDADSFIDWYLVNEIFANVDSYFFSSCWMYKDRNKKLVMGPVWDFDLGAGNVDYSGAEYTNLWWTRQGPWSTRLFEDPAFAAKVKARWNVMKTSGQIDSIIDYIDQNAVKLNQAQQNNFKRWPILNVYVWPNPVITGSYEGEVSQVKSWLRTRIAWMDGQINAAN